MAMIAPGGDDLSPRGHRAAVFDRISLGALYALLMWAPLAFGAHKGWPLAITELLALLAFSTWVLGMLVRERIEWRRTSLDLPLALLVTFVLLQLVLSNRALVSWALGPPAISGVGRVDLPTPLFTLGTVSPAQTTRSLFLLLTYAAVYILIVNLIRRRRQLDRLLRLLLVLGAVLALGGLLGYMAGDPWFVWWQPRPAAARVVATFVNPDHFGAWLAMLVCLGLGYIAARRRRTRVRFSPLDLLEREAREEVVRRYLPAVGVVLTVLALVFTLSRGAVLSLLLALGILLFVFGRVGLARWSLVAIGALMLTTLGYAAWIGLEPLVARVTGGEYINRLAQWTATIPMLPAFPAFGVGLGAYKDIFFRYQPAALGPGKIYFPYAHNDLLQLVVELGLVGSAIVLFAMWRATRDLMLAHLVGGAACPASGVRGEPARPRHPYRIGIASGAVAAALALLFQSTFDFSARIPAVGILGAACVAIATVSLHTRFGPSGETPLVPVRAFAVRSRSAAALIVVVGVGSLALLVSLVRPALVEQRLSVVPTRDEIKLEPGKLAMALARADAALAINPSDPVALDIRGNLHFDAAMAAWHRGLASSGAALAPPDQAREAVRHLELAIRDLEVALSLIPTEPSLHERLAWAYGSLAAIDASREAHGLSQAVAHLQRAIALAPEDPFMYHSLAALTTVKPQSLMEVGLAAARGATGRDPDLVRVIVDRFQPLGLTDSQWAAIVPDNSLERLQLATVLEAKGLLAPARFVYRQALVIAPASEQPFYRWMLATLLLRQGDDRGAAADLAPALEADPDNPELHLMRARILARRGDPGALAAHRIAIAKAEARSTLGAGDGLPFRLEAPRARALALERLEERSRLPLLKYRRAYARYLNDRRIWDQALEEWEAIVTQSPADADAQFSKGVALEGLAQRDRALEAYRKAVSLDGNDTRFRLRLAQTLWVRDQYYQAIEQWRTVAAMDPKNVDARLALGAAYLRVGEPVEAFREYKRVLTIAPDHPEARQALARMGTR